MRKPSLYLGLVVVSDEEDGSRRVSTHKGLDYHGLNDLQVTLIEDVLNQEFSERYDALGREVDARMIELGYVVAATSGEVTAEEVEEVRKKAKGKASGPK